MRTFLKRVAAVIKHFVFVIGGAISGAVGWIAQQYSPKGALLPKVFYGGGIIALVSAMF